MNGEFWRGRTVIVTGATGGIGRVLAKRMASYGMTVVPTGRRADALSALAEELLAAGAEKVLPAAGDINDGAFRKELVETAAGVSGRIDVLLNNAGLAQHCSLEEMTEELYDSIMALNVKAPYFLTQAALPYLRASDRATVINIASVVGHKGYPAQSVYSASKHALIGWSKAFAAEVYKENIRVHVVSPGGVYTEMIALARPDIRKESLILPEDVADIVAFYLDHRMSNAVIDEIGLHRAEKLPFA